MVYNLWEKGGRSERRVRELGAGVKGIRVEWRSKRKSGGKWMLRDYR